MPVCALLACTLTTCPPESELHKISLEMKACFQTTEACPPHLPIVIKYPEHPSKLPQKLYDHGYKEHEPEPRHVEQFAHIRGLKFLRTSSSKVGCKRKTPCTEAASSAGGMQQLKSLQGDMDGNPMMGMMGMMMNMCQSLCSAMGGTGENKEGVQLLGCRQASSTQFRPKGLQMLPCGEKNYSPGKTKAGLQAIEAPTEAKPVEEPEALEEEVPDDKCQDEEDDKPDKDSNIEEKLYQALKNRKEGTEAVKAKAKAKAKAKDEAHQESRCQAEDFYKQQAPRVQPAQPHERAVGENAGILHRQALPQSSPDGKSLGPTPKTMRRHMAERPGRQQPRSGKATSELLWVFRNLCMLLSLVCKGCGFGSTTLKCVQVSGVSQHVLAVHKWQKLHSCNGCHGRRLGWLAQEKANIFLHASRVAKSFRAIQGRHVSDDVSCRAFLLQIHPFMQYEPTSPTIAEVPACPVSNLFSI